MDTDNNIEVKGQRARISHSPPKNDKNDKFKSYSDQSLISMANVNMNSMELSREEF